MYGKSHRSYLRSGYLHHRLPVMGCVITVITPLHLQSPARQKCQRTEAGRRSSTDMQMRQRDVAALDAKYTKEIVMLKLKMMLCVMMLPLVVVGCTSKQSVSQCVKPPPPPAWIIRTPPTADTAERDYFTSERADRTMQKQLEGTVY